MELDIRALDVTDHQLARTALDGIAADHGHIDVLINNAGRGSLGTAEQLALADVRDQLEVNYLGPVALTQAVLPAMREAGHGRILTVTSVGGAVGAFAGAQSAPSAGAAIADAATSPAYRFRWQTSDQAASFAGVSLADLDGERVLSLTRTWIA